MNDFKPNGRPDHSRNIYCLTYVDPATGRLITKNGNSVPGPLAPFPSIYAKLERELKRDAL